ncbi:unnamed protein product, partial [Rotaria magnacalcarata]
GQPIGFTVAGGRGSGATLDKISTSQGLYVDDQSRVYVSEIGNDRVTRWDNTTIGVIVRSPVGQTVAGMSGVSGLWSYQFNLPTSISFDQYGYMYIMDSGNNRIQRWWPGATYGTTVASSTSLYNPRGLIIDPLG